MLLSYSRKINSSRVSDGLLVKQIALFTKKISFFMWLCQSIKEWKTIVLGFVKYEHVIPNLVEHPKSKEENALLI